MMRIVSSAKRAALFASLLLSCLGLNAQHQISGTVSDQEGDPLPFARVLLLNSPDGCLSDSSGAFHFETRHGGMQKLQVSALGFDDLLVDLDLERETLDLKLVLKERSSQLQEVVISAGTIEANNDNPVAVLKPMDIVTIAGSQGDIAGAIQALPGVQRNGGDQTGLMVRGGDVSESLVIVDGTIAQNAFFSSAPGVAARSRFNPFQFKGTSFSSGGYSVRYGQALSAVVDLRTTDLPDKSNLNLGLNFAGLAVSGAHRQDDNAIEFGGSYTNLSPYIALANTNVDYLQVPRGGGLSTRWISRGSNGGLFKMNAQYGVNGMGITIPEPEDFGQNMDFRLQNENFFFNTSYQAWKNERVGMFTAAAFSANTDEIQLGDNPASRQDSRLQARAELHYIPIRKIRFLVGSDVQRIRFAQSIDTLAGSFSETMPAAYLEVEWKPVYWFAFKVGSRGEYSTLLEKANLAPRVSLAFKTGENSQVSAAGGLFYQSAPSQYLLQGYRPGFQQSIHLMVNYQRMKNDRTFRLEGYYKSYSQLVREKGLPYNPNPYRYSFGVVDNSGEGYARGLDLFWRDQRSIPNLDYWISYSLIDTRRIYQNFPEKATPDFISTHNLNLIVKYLIEPLQTNLSLSYFYASGRRYHDPNTAAFLSDQAPDYHNFALSISYLTTIRKAFAVAYISIDNVLNRENILGYRFSRDGTTRFPVRPPIYRSVFLGVNLSLSRFSQAEL